VTSELGLEMIADPGAQRAGRWYGPRDSSPHDVAIEGFSFILFGRQRVTGASAAAFVLGKDALVEQILNIAQGCIRRGGDDRHCLFGETREPQTLCKKRKILWSAKWNPFFNSGQAVRGAEGKNLRDESLGFLKPSHLCGAGRKNE